MTQDPDKFNELNERLELLLRKQDQLQTEVNRLRRDLEGWKREQTGREAPENVASPAGKAPQLAQRPAVVSSPAPEPGPSLRERLGLPAGSLDLEKFIGENLISKIGILITVIGVAFGAKYAIDHEMISPLTRIILGYLAGLGLLGLAMRLKAGYLNFSAVLLSGALAVLYIITYFAYNYYQLFPQLAAFGLMVLFTAFAVLAALQYDRQIIALMGLVGAYGVPFLLSNDSGSAAALFTYMAIINTGILVIAFRKYWKGLFNTAFWVSWIIFSGLMVFEYYQEQYFATGMVFASIFYLLFYATFLAYKLVKKEQFKRGDILLLLANSFIFFGLGYSLLDRHPVGRELLGVFAVANAGVHFAVGRLLYRDKLADRTLFYFVIGLVLVFLTMAIPIQLDGGWVTLLWAGEAALLLWLGRSRRIPAYEKMALPLIVLAFGSLVQDWQTTYGQYFYAEQTDRFQPVLNVHLLISLLCAGIFAFMSWLQQGTRYPSQLTEQSLWRQGLRFAIPAALLLTLYFAFRGEIEYYWRLRDFEASRLREPDFTSFDYTFQRLSNIWVVYYSLFFLTILSWVNMRWVRNRLLAWVNLGLTVFALLSFLVIALYELSELRVTTLADTQPAAGGGAYSYLRYLGFLLVGALLYTTYRYQQQPLTAIARKWPFDLLLHLSALWIVSSEVIHWMDLSGSEQSYKLGLSILWGVYSLLLIALGIAQRKAYLRVGAIALFAVTLVKLFFYDIAHLNTIAKTTVLLSLGVLLLLISFLYNKFKHIIADEPVA